MRIGLVACCAKKGAEPCAAKDLYLSPLFKVLVVTGRYEDRAVDVKKPGLREGEPGL